MSLDSEMDRTLLTNLPLVLILATPFETQKLLEMRSRKPLGRSRSRSESEDPRLFLLSADL